MTTRAPLPPPATSALLLDLDGTLLDIAPSPAEVIVPDGLLDTLRRLRVRLGDALGVISGRPVDQLDALLEDAPFAVAGEHGGAIRLAPGRDLERAALPSPPAAWLERAADLAEAQPGVSLERKERGFVLHYRAAPAMGPQLRNALGALIGKGDDFELLAARMAWEVRPRGVDKGTAATALMRTGPFAGRRPIYIGDDVTDEDAIAAVETLGGVGLRVPDAFGSPEGVRQWLARSAATGEWPPLPG